MKVFLTICFVACVALYAVALVRGATISGTAADDFLVGTPYDDTIKGREGRDELHGRGGNDILEGGRGRDLVVGNEGADVIVGGRSDDVLYAWGSNSGIDYVNCGDGEDRAYVGPLDNYNPNCEHVEVLP